MIKDCNSETSLRLGLGLHAGRIYIGVKLANL